MNACLEFWSAPCTATIQCWTALERVLEEPVARGKALVVEGCEEGVRLGKRTREGDVDKSRGLSSYTSSGLEMASVIYR